MGSASLDVPGVGAFDLVADAYASRAENAPVMVDAEPFVGNVHVALGVEIFIAYVVHSQTNSEVLELAVSVGNAHRADVISFRQEEFDDMLSVFVELLRIRANDHPLGDAGNAGGLETSNPLDLDKTESTGADVADAVEVTESRNVHSMFANGLEKGLIVSGADELSVDRKRHDCHEKAPFIRLVSGGRRSPSGNGATC